MREARGECMGAEDVMFKKSLLALLKRLEWSSVKKVAPLDWRASCPVCGITEDAYHEPNCELDGLIKVVSSDVYS